MLFRIAIRSLVHLVPLLLLPSLAAQDSRPDEEETSRPWTFSPEIRTGFLAGSDLDDSPGDVDTWTVETRVNADGQVWRGGFLNVGVGYEFRHYDFDGNTTLFPTDTDPFDNVHSVRVGAQLLQGLSKEWGLFFGANMRASAAEGADLGDGVSGLFLAGVGYDFGGGFRAGIGAVALARFEDDLSIFPAVQFRWDISDEWNMQLRGLRFDVNYSPNDEWTFGFSAEVDGIRFRLPDDAEVSDGIVEDRRLGLSLRADWSPNETLTLSAEAGLAVWRELRIEDSNGDNGNSYSVDPAPLFGLGLTLKF